MTDSDIKRKIVMLSVSDNTAAHHAMLELREESRRSDGVYKYLPELYELLSSSSSFERTRGALLLCENARWDGKGRLCAMLDALICRISDEKPTAARQCIQAMPVLCEGSERYGAMIRERVITALENADISAYSDSMAPLVEKDIHESLVKIINGRSEKHAGK